MSPHVPLMKLIEKWNDEGERVFVGMLGIATILGRKIKEHDDGGGVWLFQVVEPDERARERKRRQNYNRRQRRLAEGVAEVGGMD